MGVDEVIWLGRFIRGVNGEEPAFCGNRVRTQLLLLLLSPHALQPTSTLQIVRFHCQLCTNTSLSPLRSRVVLVLIHHMCNIHGDNPGLMTDVTTAQCANYGVRASRRQDGASGSAHCG